MIEPLAGGRAAMSGMSWRVTARAVLIACFLVAGTSATSDAAESASSSPAPDGGSAFDGDWEGYWVGAVPARIAIHSKGPAGEAGGEYRQDGFGPWSIPASSFPFQGTVRDGVLEFSDPATRIRYELSLRDGGRLAGRSFDGDRESLTTVFSKAGVRSADAGKRADPCSAADNIVAVRNATHCFVLHSFGAARAPGAAPSALVIVIHGSGSSRWPMVSTVNMAEVLGALMPGITAVAILRPGYLDRFGGRSYGGDQSRVDNNTYPNLTALAEALSTIRTHHKPARTILVGHSSGADAAAVLMALFPGIADAAVLLGCPCNTVEYNQRFGMTNTRSISPHLMTDTVPTTARIVAIAGDRDRNVGPHYAQYYIGALQRRGVPAEFITVPNVDHNGLLSGYLVAPVLERLLARTR